MAGESLQVVSGTAAGRAIPIAGVFVVGRGEAGEGNLGGDTEISRRHALFRPFGPGQVAVEDLGSTNGTYVNGQRIAAPQALATGDQVQVGRTVLRFDAGVQQPAPPAIQPPPPAPAFQPGDSKAPAGRRGLWALLAVLVIAGVVVAVVALSGGGSGDGAGAADASSPTATVRSFYDAAATGDSAKACSLLAPGANGPDVGASLLVAGTGSLIGKSTDCESTLDALHNVKPKELSDALPRIQTREENATGTRSEVVISLGNSKLVYRATLVKQGNDWRIQAVAL